MRNANLFAASILISLTTGAFADSTAPANPIENQKQGGAKIENPIEPAHVLSPAVRAALADLSSENFKTREGALQKLQLALGEQLKALVSSDDPEVQSRLVSLLQFNDGISRWALDALKLPAEQRKAQLEFGLSPDILPLMGLIYSTEPERRVEGIKALAKNTSEQATAMLARLLDDNDRQVYIAAMEAVWDRKPSDAVVDALWARAVDSMNAMYQPQPMAAQNIKFRGKTVQNTNYYFPTFYSKMADANIAGDVLLNLNAPQIPAKLKASLEKLETMSVNQPWLLNSNSEQIKNIFRLIEAYKPTESLVILYRWASGPVRGSNQGQMNAEKYQWSNRTAAIAAIIVATGQKPEDYKLKKQAINLGGMWTTPTAEDENEAIKKLQEWAAANGEKFGLTAAATQPATQPAAKPAAIAPAGGAIINVGGNGAVIIHGGAINGQIQVQAVVGEEKEPKPDPKEKPAPTK